MKQKDQIEEYFKSPRISNSLLGLINTPKLFKFFLDNPDIENEETKALRIGSALDCLLTSPDRWNNDFNVIDVVRPGGMMQKFLDSLPPGLNQDSDIEFYRDAYNKSGYKKSIQLVVKDLWSKFNLEEYYKAISSIKPNQTLLSKDEFDLVTVVKESLLSNPFTREYFINDYSHIELIHQFPIYFKLEDMDCKALLDGVKIDHENKTVTPFDLKTTSKNSWDFPIAFWEYGYYRQCALYTEAIKDYMNRMKDIISWGDYELKPFEFVVVKKELGRFVAGAPFIWVVADSDLYAGMHGGKLTIPPYRKMPGILELIQALKWHIKTNKWELPYELYQTNGKTELKIFGGISEDREENNKV